MTTTHQLAADTFGWDTVFALRIPDVNRAIARAKTSPQTFSQRIEEGCTVSGTFTDWHICQGGDGKILRLALPIPSGQLEVVGKTTAFRNATAIAEVQLNFFEQTASPPTDTIGSRHELRIATAPAAGQEAAVVVLDLTFDDANPPFLVKSLLPLGLTTWLNQHLELFDHVFATINLNQRAATDGFSWLLPTATDYAYVERATLEDSFLAVLCMTEHRPAQGLLPELAVGAIPALSRAGFLISKSRFLTNLLQPNLPHAFKGLVAADFEPGPGGDRLELKSPKTIATTTHEGKTYHTQLTTLTISVANDQLQFRAISATEISPGIYAHSDSLHRYAIQLVTTPAGKQTLNFQEIGVPVVTRWTTTAPGLELLTWMEIVIGIVLTIVLSVLTEGAAFSVGCVLIAALVGAATQVPNLVGFLGTDAAPDLSLLTFNSTNAIEWNDSRDFHLNAAGLNSSLQLGGTFATG